MSPAFFLTALVVVATPGVGVLYTISAAIARGTRVGLVAAIGCTLGIVPHLAAAVTGTAALLRTSAVAFQAVKVLGIAYLLYMAVMTWRDTSELTPDPDHAPKSNGRVIGSAVLANLLNPKLTLFFFAFLPQFVPRHGHDQLITMLGLSAVFMAMTLTVFALYGVLAGALRARILARPHIIRRLRRAFAASFVGLGARLALTARS